ncbi:MAG: hypothetical protein HYU52_07135 [Acidobacteria bacterium]|nr:hypothetical protein [Acidobacteriota bacterium]
MLTQLLFVPIALAIIALVFVVIDYRAALREWAGSRQAVCPRDDTPVTVKVDARSAARTAALGVPIHLRLESCSHWPERAGCDQRCLRQISPTHTAVPKTA